MRLLLLSTCGAVGTVALADGPTLVAAEALPGRGASEALLPALRAVFAVVGWQPAAVQAVAVVTGPGSFTGVRVGVAAAKGFAEAHGARLVALSRLRLLAGPEGAAVLDAGRRECFFGRCQGGELLSEELLSRNRLGEVPASAITCEPAVAAALGLRLQPEPDAAVMLALVLEQIALGRWADPLMLDANYLRRTDAELKVRP